MPKGSSENSRKNLKPFKPGESGNPKGKKPGTLNITTIIKKKLKEVAPTDKAGRKYINLLAESLILNAMKGNGTAIKSILDRVDGVVAEEQNLTGDITLTVKYAEADEP